MSEKLTTADKLEILRLACEKPPGLNEGYEERYKKMIDLVVNYETRSKRD